MLRKLVVGPYQTNCYILGCEKTKQGAVIDPGDEVYRIVREITRNALRISFILFTHGHPDHTGGAADLKRITKAPLLIHRLDAPGLGVPPDGYLQEGQQIQVGHYKLRVIHTPGHSPGGVCFHAPGAVFTGDALFAGSVGRTDFPGGNHTLLIQGIRKKIFPLGDSLRVYPGHGPASTIGTERRRNPFFAASI
ncbi:MAG: MBL fold metallo-hydrolase [Deltaproteobacteria bacterium]|nr:MBL fold metallo-hydrolase [Deltaproteobacteria bacterium]MBW2015326.1 MBL fold metallo-hydrolase [Deltaproteobacteria bacterium]MBW2128187.1 MBL fold metallo-hydrolase [Deltaproteobacteria bacterium]MBW2303096.1 MBL fold metallo-hydrolase [Deltaproteobacteria bacterium]